MYSNRRVHQGSGRKKDPEVIDSLAVLYVTDSIRLPPGPSSTEDS